jgi:hypothetical protein
VTKPSPMQPQPEDSSEGQAIYATSTGMSRRVSVKACQGEDATVVVTVVQGNVWMSIVPLFTLEAIMEPGKVGELMGVLEMPREEAKRMVRVNGRWVVRGERAVVRGIRGEIAPPGKQGRT